MDNILFPIMLSYRTKNDQNSAIASASGCHLQ